MRIVTEMLRDLELGVDDRPHASGGFAVRFDEQADIRGEAGLDEKAPDRAFAQIHIRYEKIAVVDAREVLGNRNHRVEFACHLEGLDLEASLGGPAIVTGQFVVDVVEHVLRVDDAPFGLAALKEKVIQAGDLTDLFENAPRLDTSACNQRIKHVETGDRRALIRRVEPRGVDVDLGAFEFADANVTSGGQACP